MEKDLISNETKAKVFAQYLPFYIGTPASLALMSIIEKMITGDVKETIQYRLSSLRPLSAITDEDAIEVAKIFHWQHLSKESQIHQVKEVLLNFNHQTNIHADEWLACFQYLQSYGYDLPQYLLNGKTLAEAGLAVYSEASKAESKTKENG